MRCVVGKTSDFPDLKIDTFFVAVAVFPSHELVDDSCMWKEIRIRSKPPLKRFSSYIIHMGPYREPVWSSGKALVN